MSEAAPRELPEHVTTPLLTLLTRQALEEDYRVVSERRAAGGDAAEPPRTRVAAATAIAVLGLLISVAAVQASRDQEVTDAGRATLIARIEAERAALEDRRDRIADLTRDNQVLTETLTDVTAARQQAVTELRRLELSVGYLPATGEGVRIVVDDNPEGGTVQQVTDADLAMLVNGLWEAGAEAIAINDQRLNPLGSIRNVGSAVHVNTVPLSPPYVVRAIGDMDTLQAELLNTSHGAEFFSLADHLGFEYSRQNEEELSLPAARPRRLSHAAPGTADQRRRSGIEEGAS